MLKPPYRLLLLSLAALATTALSFAIAPTSDLSPIHHPVNLTSTPQNSTTIPLPLTNGQAHCTTSTTPLTRRKPRFADCGAAIRKLPLNHIIGTFHRAGEDNIFRVPLEETSGSCTVRVDMIRREVVDTCTWLTVGAAAGQLNMACVGSFSFPLKLGGWTTVGRDDGILIRLQFSGKTRNSV